MNENVMYAYLYDDAGHFSYLFQISPVINVHLETTRCIKVIGSSSSQIIHDFVKGNILPIFTRLILRSSSLDDNNSSGEKLKFI